MLIPALKGILIQNLETMNNGKNYYSYPAEPIIKENGYVVTFTHLNQVRRWLTNPNGHGGGKAFNNYTKAKETVNLNTALFLSKIQDDKGLARLIAEHLAEFL